MEASPRLLPCGDSAIAVEFGNAISIEINSRVMALDAALQGVGHPILETVPTYRSLLVYFDAASSSYEEITAIILDGLASPVTMPSAARVWRVPVVYGGPFGIDLIEFGETHNMTAGEVIRRHCSGLYFIYTIGFMPGFAYLGGLDPALETPRRSTPRLSIPAGSVTIGGAQSAITSVEAPSGWHVIGRSPVQAFMADREPPCLFSAGDFVTFFAVEPEEWPSLHRASCRGDLVAELVQ